MDEKSMLAGYAATYGDEKDRSILADYFEERGDPRGGWLRDPELAHWMGPEAADPFAKLVAALPDEDARRLLLRFGAQSVPALIDAWPGGVTPYHDAERRQLLSDILREIATGVPGLITLIESLRSADPRDQRAALASLAERGEAAGPAIPAILRLLNEDRASIREAALDTLEHMRKLTESALYAAWGEAGWNSEDEFGNYRLPLPLIDACARLGPESRLARCIVQAMNTSNYHVPERARDVLIGFGLEVFEIVLQEGSSLDRGKSRVHEVLQSYPNASERLLAAAKDTSRPGKQRGCAIASLPRSGQKEGDSEYDWLIPHLIELLGDTDPDVQREAIWALSAFGERAACAAPALIRLLSSSNDLTPYAVLSVLEKQGPDVTRAALPFVRPLLEHSSKLVQGVARRFIGRFTEAGDQVREIREALRSHDPERRKLAVPRLLALPEQFPDLLDLLRAALADPSEAVFRTAASAILQAKWPEGIDPRPLLQTTLGELLKRLQSAEPESRARIIRLLGKKSVRGPKALSAVCAALADEEEVRWGALQVLRDDWRPLPAEAMPGLLQLVRSEPSHHGRDAASLLLEVYPPPAEFLPALRERLRLPEGGPAALEPLDRLGYTPTQEEAPLLAAVLVDDQARFYRGQAARLLARMGRSALPILLDHLTPDNACWVARALATMGPVAGDALPALGALIDHDWSFVRVVIVEAIADIGTPAEIIPLLRPAFHDRQGSVRGKLLEVCVRLGADARPWLPELMHLVRTEQNPEELGSGNLASTLAGLAEHIPEVIGLLRQSLQEPGTARTNAVAALAVMGHRASEALSEIEVLLLSAGKEEGKTLGQALMQIRGHEGQG